MSRFTDFASLPLVAGLPEGWSTWSPRAEIAPRFSVDAGAGRAGRGALRIDAGVSPAAHGGWRREVDVTGGRFYRVRAWYRAEGVSREARSVTARLVWPGASAPDVGPTPGVGPGASAPDVGPTPGVGPGEGDGAPGHVRTPDYCLGAGPRGRVREDGWTRVEHVTVAPDRATRAVVELGLRWAPGGTVWWDDIELLEEPEAPSRPVRIATVHHRPVGERTNAGNLERLCELVAREARPPLDLLCLSEAVTYVGTGRTLPEAAEPVPGPSTERLGELARELGSYVVAGLLERAGDAVYNIGVLVDRAGALAGIYRKTHIPTEESDGGITPGDEYPVFDTDFARVGMLICWDNHFPEPSRALALKGAEVIALMVWGGHDFLARARAFENHVWLVSSSYDMRSFVLDPNGEVLAEATADSPVAVAEVDLARPVFCPPWLGHMRTRTWTDRRGDLALE